jgi:putative flippase GtrA
VLLYELIQIGIEYRFSLIIAIVTASASNFILNKKWTFHEKIWG